MNDVFAAYPAYTPELLDKLAQKPPGNHAPTLIDLMAQAMVSDVSKAAAQQAYQKVIRSQAYRNHLQASKALAGKLGLEPPARLDLSKLPRYSFYLRVDFRLKSPWLGRDDRAFSITDNPVRKDRALGLPLIAATTWKGTLRGACRAKCDAQQQRRLFGPEADRAAEEEDFKGRLYFYPTFFSAVNLEIINPHDRERRIGKNPIKMESVPKGTEGRFAALYVALKRDGPLPEREADFRAEVAADVRAVTAGCAAMMLELGFSAKRSSGYGEASQSLVGQLGILDMPAVPGWQPGFRSLRDMEHKGTELSELLGRMP